MKQPIDTNEDIAKVIAVHGNIAQVEMSKKGACDSCGMSGFCMGKKNSIVHEITYEKKLEIGDLVKIEIAPRYKLFSSFMIFVFPVLMMMTFFLISFFIFELSEKWSVLFSLVSLVCSGFIVFWIDKKWAKKIDIKIIEKVDL